MRRIVATEAPGPRVFSPLTIGAAIRASRTQSAMRQIDAASLCGVSLQTYVDIEKGSTGVSIGLVLKVADEMGVRLFAFMGDDADRMLYLAEKEGWVEGP